jgi:hypothetical protein
MLDTFTNIDGAGSATQWYSYSHNTYHSSNIIGYTVVKSEVPLIYTGDNDTYWNSATVNMTKLNQAGGNIFAARHAYNVSTFKAYLNGVEVSDISHGAYNTFIIPTSNADGYLFISYTPSTSSEYIGNTVSTLNGASVRSKYVIPQISKQEIQRCRQAINNLQKHVEFAYSPWIGGTGNTERSSYDNIIPGKTEVYLDHILEMREALVSLNNKINSNGVETITLSDVADDSYFRVEYLEEIRKAINDLELSFISQL